MVEAVLVVVVARKGRLEVGPLGVLPLALVRVLVAAEGLGGREVAAAVVALEPPDGVHSHGCGGIGGGGFFRRGVDGVGGGVVVRDVDAKKADSRSGGGGGGGVLWWWSVEWKLREGFNCHEVMSSSRLWLAHFSEVRGF